MSRIFVASLSTLVMMLNSYANATTFNVRKASRVQVLESAIGFYPTLRAELATLEVAKAKLQDANNLMTSDEDKARRISQIVNEPAFYYVPGSLEQRPTLAPQYARKVEELKTAEIVSAKAKKTLVERAEAEVTILKVRLLEAALTSGLAVKKLTQILYPLAEVERNLRTANGLMTSEAERAARISAIVNEPAFYYVPGSLAKRDYLVSPYAQAVERLKIEKIVSAKTKAVAVEKAEAQLKFAREIHQKVQDESSLTDVICNILLGV